jgi:riboflavin kinase/FMN adenylyltransferase
MQVHTSLPTSGILSNAALTVGTFDGVHRGHQFLIENLKREAARESLAPAVLTFQDMPYCFFRPDDCPRLLTLPAEKIAAFEKLEIEHLFIVPFDDQIAQSPYDVFARQVLCEKLGMKLLVAGPDFALGKNRAGDVAALKALSAQLNFEVRVLDEKLKFENAPISSTRVRNAIENGHVENASQMMGHAFEIEGEVVSGKQLGRTIGVPTINLKTHARKVVPRNGVYAARAIFPDASTHRVALSIGTNPTTDSDDSTKIEFHVIGQNIETPPKNARLEIVARLRDEAKFASLDDLISQMRRDIVEAGRVLA